MHIAHQGTVGAYSQQACLTLPETVTTTSYPSFVETIAAVVGHQADYAMIPVRNSIAGVVQPTLPLMSSTTLSICAEVALPIHHCLLTKPGSHIETITEVHSHPQALAQCSHFIQEHGWQACEASNTAMAAQFLSEQGQAHQAVIASAAAAQQYHLEILQEHIANTPDNTTHFFLLGRETLSYLQKPQQSTLFAQMQHPTDIPALLNQHGIENAFMYIQSDMDTTETQSIWLNTPCHHALLQMLSSIDSFSATTLHGPYPTL